MSQTQSLIEKVSSDAVLEQNRGIQRYCYFCQHQRNKKVLMQLQLENWWHMCPECKGVQPVNTSIPLWWIYCPNIIKISFATKLSRIIKNRFNKKKLEYFDRCLYPMLATAEHAGTKTHCKKCNFEYTIKIGV